MDLKSRKLVWLLVGALGIGLILEGAASAVALARYSPATHVLLRGDTQYPIAIGRTRIVPDRASRIRTEALRFGGMDTYFLPDNSEVTCRFYGPIARCSGGWSAVFPQ
ncbi:MAG: hypothetical protein AAFQ79_17365 [Pseudomonadota bacterium]